MKNKRLIKRAKFGDNIGNWGKGLAQFAIGNIPLFGDNINKAVGLDDFEAKNKFARGLQKVNQEVISPIKDQVAGMALDATVPGLGTVAQGINQGLDNAQFANKTPKNSGMSLSDINPRYAQAGGKIVNGGVISPLSSTGSAAIGQSHKEGGIKLNKEVEVEGGEGIHKIGKDVVVSSDSLQNPETGHTFAEEMTQLESQKGKLEQLLAAELKRTDNKTNHTVILYKKKIKEVDDKIRQLYMKQESVATQMGLRDKNGNPNQTSQDIVEGPQNQAMKPTEAFKLGGRISKLKRYAFGKPSNSNPVIVPVEDIPGISSKKAQKMEDQAIYNSEPDFEYDPNNDPGLMDEFEVIDKRPKKKRIGVNEVLQNINTGLHTLGTNSKPFNTYKQNEYFTPIDVKVVPTRPMMYSSSRVNQNQNATPSINSKQVSPELTTNITSPQKEILYNNRQEALDDLKMRMGKYNPIANANRNYQNVSRKVLNLPIKAQTGLTGNSALFDTLNQYKGLMPKQQSPFTNPNSGIANAIEGFKGFPQMPEKTKFPDGNDIFGQLNRKRDIQSIPLNPLQRGQQSPLFPGIKAMPLAPFNQRGFDNKVGLDNYVPMSNLGPRPLDKNVGGGETGSGGGSADDGKTIWERTKENRIKKFEEKGTDTNPADILKKPSIGEGIEKETHEWMGSLVQSIFEQEKIDKAKKEQEQELQRVKDIFNIPYTVDANGTVVYHNTPPPASPPTRSSSPPPSSTQPTQPKAPTYETEEDVRAFQIWANQQGEKLDPDGKYGPKTKAAYTKHKDKWRNEFHGKPLEPEQQPAQVAETSPGYEAAKANGGQIINIDGKEAVRTPDGKIVYRDGSSTAFNPSTTSKYGSNLSRLKRFQDGGYTKVGTTTDGKDMYRSNEKGGMYTKNDTGNYNEYSDSSYGQGYGQVQNNQGQNLNYGISGSHAKRDDIPVIGENKTNSTSNVRTPQTVPQTIPSRPIPQPTPKPIIDNDNNTKNAGNAVKGLIPGVGDIPYPKKSETLPTNTTTGFNIDNPNGPIRNIKDITTPPFINNTPSNIGLPLNSNMLTGKKRIPFENHRLGPQLQPLPKYDFNYSQDNYTYEDMEKYLKILNRYGFNTDTMTKKQLSALSNYINRRQYGGQISKFKSGGWIGKVTKSIKRRGTEGRCTGSNFGGPGCPPGSRQYNLAVTFRKMARNRKHQSGGKIYDQKGYLSSNKNNYTSKKIIRGRNGQTPITTNGMAFPITANGKLLFPNTGQYIFPGNTVVETPIKALFGMTTSGSTSMQSMGPQNFVQPDSPTPIPPLPGKSSNPTGPTIPPLPTYPPVKTDEELKKEKEAAQRAERVKKLTGIAEPILAASPALIEGGFQLFSDVYKDMKRKYPTQERYGEGLAEMKAGMQNALPNAQKMINDNQMSALSTTLQAATNSGENVGNLAGGIASQIQKSGNELYATTLSNLQNQYSQYHQFTKAIEDAKAQEDWQTYTQALKNRQDIQRRLQDSIGKSLENLNAYATTYGPDGQKRADQMFFDMLKNMPWLGQNDEFKNYAKKYGFDVNTDGTLSFSKDAPTPSISSNAKYGGNIRIKR